MAKAKTMTELANTCATWVAGDDAFAEIVAAYLDLSGVPQRTIADEFEAAISTVSRWASGTARPHPKMQKLIVSWIGKRAKSATSSQKPEMAIGGGIGMRLPMAASSKR